MTWEKVNGVWETSGGVRLSWDGRAWQCHWNVGDITVERASTSREALDVLAADLEAMAAEVRALDAPKGVK